MAYYNPEEVNALGIYGTGGAELGNDIEAAILAIPQPDRSENPKVIAEAIYAVLKKHCEAADQRPEIETFFRTVGKEGRCVYTVSWEAGPHDWAQLAWPIVMDLTGRLCEPTYGFDLDLYDIE